MPPKISKSLLTGLAQELRDNPDILKGLTFPDAVTSFTLFKTQDLRFDVHKDSQQPGMATGIIQANSEAKNNAVKAFLKGRTGGHRGTHQVIGNKISFHLGAQLDIEMVAGAIETAGLDRAIVSGSSSSAGQGDASQWPTTPAWTWSEQYRQYYRLAQDGTYEWWCPAGTANTSSVDGEWTWSAEHLRFFRTKADGSYEWYVN